MASVPVSKRTTRNNLPGRLNIPTNSLTPNSSAPSSLSPLIVPISNSNGSSTTHQQQTNELISVMGRITPQPLEDDNKDFFHDESVKVTAPDGEEINPANFRELSRLGEGAGGTVSKVENKSTGHIMAKKKINVVLDPKIYKQILRELQFLRTCHSPNIVSYYGAILEDSDSSIAIFMEYCEGGSLDAIYKNVSKRQGRIGEKVLGKIAESVLKGLVYLYSQQIIHRDIKPSNILVTKKGEIKICDFGVSGELVSSVADTFLGTSYYMAPERILGLPYKVSADVWSLGLTIMEVAQNRFPFPSFLSPIELVTYIANLPAPTLSDEYQWSEELKDFLKICLEKDGEKRPTPKQMLDHPFIQLSSQRQVKLELWIKQVWEWKG
ncbi:kinase-like domain-containing protein [Rhizophagus diaphanus]|nr:kinase-like domain-containing protein [Rhizophagus diaphanus] [Rhizophagus sp. MUCL 43196]